MTCYLAFPNYPAIEMPELPLGWHDASSHQDRGPRYTRDDGRVTVYIGWPAPPTECNGYMRFLVHCDGDVFSTNRWEYVLSRAARTV